MKVTLVTPSTSRAQQWAQALSQADRSRVVRSVIKPLHEVPYLVNGNVPDLAVLDLSEARDAAALEVFVRAHPALKYVLVGEALPVQVLERVLRLGLRDVQVALPEAQDIADAARRLSQPEAAAEVVTFLGCKGGCGATFTAANLACLLAAGGRRRVALLDLNLQLGDALLFVSNQRPPSDVASLARNLHRLDRDLLQSAMLQVTPGLHVLAAPEDDAAAHEVQPEHIRHIIELARQNFDLVVIDADRRLDAVTRQALDLSTRIGLVLQLALPSIRDGKRLQQLLGTLGHPAHQQHWIVNRYQSGGPITLDDVRRILGLSDLLTLPNHYELVSRSVNQGVPVNVLAPHSALVRGLQKVAGQIDADGVTAAPRNRWLSSLWPRSGAHS